MKTIRYHIQCSMHRTTVSMDKIISDLMAIKLGFKPNTSEAHQAVRKRLGAFVKHYPLSIYKLSQYIKEQAILDCMDTILSRKYLEWVVNK